MLWVRRPLQTYQCELLFPLFGSHPKIHAHPRYSQRLRCAVQSGHAEIVSEFSKWSTNPRTWGQTPRLLIPPLNPGIKVAWCLLLKKVHRAENITRLPMESCPDPYSTYLLFDSVFQSSATQHMDSLSSNLSPTPHSHIIILVWFFNCSKPAYKAYLSHFIPAPPPHIVSFR